jgi:hypothetical protein
MDRSILKSIADQINTGACDIDVARALVVFNVSDEEITGIAGFAAEIGWLANDPLPAISISELDGNSIPSAMRSISKKPDPKGRPGRCRISFELVFATCGIPASGWKTYTAVYSDEVNGTPLLSGTVVDERLIVIETLFHDGRFTSISTEPESNVRPD